VTECGGDSVEEGVIWMTGDLDGYASVVWHEMLPASALTG